MNICALDIETIVDAERLEVELAKMEFRAKANLVDPAKIEADIQAKKDKFVEQAALNPRTGKVACVALLGADGPWVIAEATERRMLHVVNTTLARFDQIVTFNGLSFDTHFLDIRMRMHGLTVPRVLRGASPYPPYGNKSHVDMFCVLNQGPRGEGTLAAWCRAFGVEEPEEHSYTDIARWYEEGKHEEIARVCESDVRALWDLYTAYGHID